MRNTQRRIRIAALTLVVLLGAAVLAVQIFGATPSGRAACYASTTSAGESGDTRPRTYDMPPDQTRQVAAAVISRMPNWKLVGTPADAPDGAVQADVKKAFGLLTDRVVVKVAADGRNARVSVASASRIEDGILGANVGNIRALQAAMDERLPPAS